RRPRGLLPGWGRPLPRLLLEPDGPGRARGGRERLERPRARACGGGGPHPRGPPPPDRSSVQRRRLLLRRGPRRVDRRTPGRERAARRLVGLWSSGAARGAADGELPGLPGERPPAGPPRRAGGGGALPR